jgi:ADP-heptose:LPS heptosyltransferase
MPAPKHILVMRFSAMGDVAMTVPVVKAVLEQNPGLQITYVSRPGFVDFFKGVSGLNYFEADFELLYNGFAGPLKLFKKLKGTAKYDAVADLHDSLRSKFLRRLFRFNGAKVAYIDKGRAEKKLLTRFPNKILKPLKRTTERYADVFRQLGLQVDLDYLLKKQTRPLNDHTIAVTGDKYVPWIGIAPFAKHKGKIYPFEKMEEVIAALSKEPVKLLLFGGSTLEEEICNKWAGQYENVVPTVRLLDMDEELAVISNLEVMLSMDSAGMHLASLVGTPVVSVWGATHHYAGFLGYGQSEENIIADTIECRPCSVYGNKPCFRKDYACMQNINAMSIVDKINELLIE